MHRFPVLLPKERYSPQFQSPPVNAMNQRQTQKIQQAVSAQNLSALSDALSSETWSEQGLVETFKISTQAGWSEGRKLILKNVAKHHPNMLSVNLQADVLPLFIQGLSSCPEELDVFLNVLDPVSKDVSRFCFHRLVYLLPENPKVWQKILDHPVPLQKRWCRTNGSIVSCIDAYQTQRQKGQDIDESLESLYLKLQETITPEEAWRGAYRIATWYLKPSKEEKDHTSQMIKNWIKMCQTQSPDWWNELRATPIEEGVLKWIADGASEWRAIVHSEIMVNEKDDTIDATTKPSPRAFLK